MEEKHPHDGATYTILRLTEGAFGVEVTIPGAKPVIVAGLDGEAGAERWIARHKEAVAHGSPRRNWVFGGKVE
jgi:hypothetical protein